MIQGTIDPDAELMLRVANGEFECYDLLVRKHRISLIHFIHRMVRNYAIAEELAQDALLRAYQNRHGYQPRGRFTTWLFCIGSNLALNWLRDHRHDLKNWSLEGPASQPALPQYRDHAPLADEVMDERKRGHRLSCEVQRVVSQLPERQRKAVMLHRFEELAYSEVADSLGWSVGQVKSLLYRAHETMRKRLEGSRVSATL